MKLFYSDQISEPQGGEPLHGTRGIHCRLSPHQHRVGYVGRRPRRRSSNERLGNRSFLPGLFLYQRVPNPDRQVKNNPGAAGGHCSSGVG